MVRVREEDSSLHTSTDPLRRDMPRVCSVCRVSHTALWLSRPQTRKATWRLLEAVGRAAVAAALAKTPILYYLHWSVVLSFGFFSGDWASVSISSLATPLFFINLVFER